MSFTEVCVFIVITLAIAFVTFLMHAILDDDDCMILPWIVCAIGFGGCLTIVLIQNGVI